jgi:hypothetical protein
MDELSERPDGRGTARADCGGCAALGGALPREATVGWGGYLAGLIEWDVISIAEHEQLCRMLPPVENSPVTHILIGWDEAGDGG